MSRNDKKWTTYFFIFFLLCPQLILQFIEGVQLFNYRENYTFPMIPRGLTFSRVGGGGQTFSRGGGPNHNI